MRRLAHHYCVLCWSGGTLRAALDPDALFACLDRNGVKCVLIGGLAAVLHGSPLPTVYADIGPSREPDNLARLSAALTDLDARIRSAETPGGVPFPRDATFPAGAKPKRASARKNPQAAPQRGPG